MAPSWLTPGSSPWGKAAWQVLHRFVGWHQLQRSNRRVLPQPVPDGNGKDGKPPAVPAAQSHRIAAIPSRLRRVATDATVRPRRRAAAWSGIFPRRASARASQCRNGDWRPS
jgi:hypothetical protein